VKHRRRAEPEPSLWRLIIASAVLATAAVAPAAADSSYTPAVTIGAQLEGGSYFFMPNASILASATFPITGAKIEIAPNLGVSYIFFPMTGLSGSWYIPVGLELRFPNRQLGIVVRNLFPITNIFGEGGVTAALEGYLPFAKPDKSIFSLAVEAGTTIFWNTTTRPLYLISLSASFRYDYQVKRLS